jgi:hypothetical protein
LLGHEAKAHTDRKSVLFYYLSAETLTPGVHIFPLMDKGNNYRMLFPYGCVLKDKKVLDSKFIFHMKN